MHADFSGLCGRLSAEPIVASTSASEPGRVGCWVWGKFSFIRCSDEQMNTADEYSFAGVGMSIELLVFKFDTI